MVLDRIVRMVLSLFLKSQISKRLDFLTRSSAFCLLSVIQIRILSFIDDKNNNFLSFIDDKNVSILSFIDDMHHF